MYKWPNELKRFGWGLPLKFHWLVQCKTRGERTYSKGWLGTSLLSLFKVNAFRIFLTNCKIYPAGCNSSCNFVMIAQLFFFSIKMHRGPMAEWVLKFYWVFKPINKLKNLSQASAWREMKITILTNPILTKSMCNFDDSRSKHWQLDVATVKNPFCNCDKSTSKRTSPWIISGNLHILTRQGHSVQVSKRVVGEWKSDKVRCNDQTWVW